MKKFTFLFALFLFESAIYSQAPGIEWQNTIGGDASDNLYSVRQTIDGGYILGGKSSSGLSGDKTDEGNGSVDYWVIKLDTSGNIEWQNAIGGSQTDYLFITVPTADNGFILGGVSNSGISGDKTGVNFGPPGTMDYWIVKIDSAGNIKWDKTIGASAEDKLTSINLTNDNGYIIGGYSNSPISGDKTENSLLGGLNGYDYWVVRIDSIGNILWDNTIGGNGDDYLNSVQQTTDGGFILGGYSNSNISGDKTDATIGLTGLSDYWVIKINSSGTIEWQNTLGGNDWDYLYSAEQTSDGEYILGGFSASGISGNKTQDNLGFDDYWVIKIDATGSPVWQTDLGGTSNDRLYSIKQTLDGGFILGGFSDSNISANKTEEGFGAYDYWVVKLSEIGSIEWDKTLGGSDFDYLYSVQQASIEPTADFGFVLGGTSQSGISGNKTEPNMGLPGFADYWVIKLFPENCTTANFYADEDEDGFGNILVLVSSCIAPLGFISDSTDCNDTNSAIYPGASEMCNDLDDDCNFMIDEGLPVYEYYFDLDNDTYGDIFSFIISCYESPPISYVTDSTDCDDTEELIHEPSVYYTDLDGDFFGDALNSELFCSIFPPLGFVTNNLDCDDSNPLINPFSNEILNGVDDNCNDTIDEGLVAINDIYSNAFEIYPNPNNGSFQLQLRNPNAESIVIEVFNLLGEDIYLHTFDSKNIIQIELPSAFSGMAYIRIKLENSYKSELINVLK